MNRQPGSEQLHVERAIHDAGFTDPVCGEPGFRRLVADLLSMGRLVVAYSGGVDSTFLLRVAWGVLGDRAGGVLAVSESLDQSELTAARTLLETLGIPFDVIETREYDNPDYRRNDARRCYHCKSELFDQVTKYAAARGIPYVVDGSNADDVGDYRPGLVARDEHSVRSPLLEAGLNKETIRRYSRALGLPTWDKPATPCLSSRIPYGSEVTFEKLRQVESAEAGLRRLGLRVVRVRHHGQVARIEVPVDELSKLVAPELRIAVSAAVKKAGFDFVALDLEGFRSGSLNAVLQTDAEARITAPRLVPVESVSKFDRQRDA